MKSWRPLTREKLSEIQERHAIGLIPERMTIPQMAAEIHHMDKDYHRLWHALQAIAGTSEQMAEWLNFYPTVKVADMTPLEAVKTIARHVLEVVDEPAR